jgi:hypothetical protein
MPHSVRDFCQRAELREMMDAPCSREQLRGCLRDIARINRWTLTYRPVLRWPNALAANAVQWIAASTRIPSRAHLTNPCDASEAS